VKKDTEKKKKVRERKENQKKKKKKRTDFVDEGLHIDDIKRLNFERNTGIDSRLVQRIHVEFDGQKV
jgi:hypothetical protein